MLKVTNLFKNYGSHKVLKGVSFEVQKGSIYGFLGQNGAGKSTTMNILTGLIDYNSGDISYDGIDFKKNKRALLNKVGYLTQDPVFYGYMNAIEYLNFIGKINGLTPKESSKRCDELLQLTKLKESAKRRISGYSGGMKQRLGIAVALFNNPEMLFLDEPTSALDPEGRMEILEFINNLKDKGTTIFLSSHILSDIERVCDEVSIINDGKIVLSDKLENLKNEYIQPIYDIEFQDNCDYIKEELLKLSWVENAKSNNNKLSVYLKDLNAGKSEFLKELSKFNTPVLSFNLRRSNLEDIFMRMVNKDENI